MTPHEKAKELIDKYDQLRIANYKHLFPDWSKQCALIAVDQLIKEHTWTNQIIWNRDRLYYWNKVKSEIEKL
jgi:hypothetical protein